MCRDFWYYISMEYFKQKIVINEVGSSAMPHKINPIDFENAEGNLGLANSLLIHLSQKLPISRLQRDLTDSTTLWNIGVPFAHTILAFKSLNKGLSKLLINKNKISKDLEENWSVVAEGIQTMLEKKDTQAHMKNLGINQKKWKNKQTTINEFINSLDISLDVKNDLKITPLIMLEFKFGNFFMKLSNMIKFEITIKSIICLLLFLFRQNVLKMTLMTMK